MPGCADTFFWSSRALRNLVCVWSIKKFPKDLLINIEHIILSHQGKYEWQSPKKPAFAEALFVHLIDLLDSQMNIMLQAISNDQDIEDFTSKYNYYKIPLLKRSIAAK